MLVDVKQDRTGSVVLTPANARTRGRMRRHMAEVAGSPYDSVYLEDWRGDEFLDQRLSPSKRSMVRRGFTQTIRMDPWEYGLMAGYDLENVI
jgi:hypothetical protein